MKSSYKPRLAALLVASLNGFQRMLEYIVACLVAIRIAKWLNIL